MLVIVKKNGNIPNKLQKKIIKNKKIKAVLFSFRIELKFVTYKTRTRLNTIFNNCAKYDKLYCGNKKMFNKTKKTSNKIATKKFNGKIVSRFSFKFRENAYISNCSRGVNKVSKQNNHGSTVDILYLKFVKKIL